MEVQGEGGGEVENPTQVGYRFRPGHCQMLRRSFIVALAFCAFGSASCRGHNNYQEEADNLARLLNWKPGNVVADIGAGDGQMALATAKYVGAAGKVYATELDTKKLAHLGELAAKDKNITVLKAAETVTNLPPECCDSIYMRLVYHHLTNPAEIDASLGRSLKAGGLLAVIDQEPRSGTSVPEGVPKNRGGHGIPQILLIDELTAAGFQIVTTRDKWPKRHYCVVVRKPGP
jgi:ubiquinone/menaquinone biosynthesis C-methylase UbiE